MRPSRQNRTGKRHRLSSCQSRLQIIAAWHHRRLPGHRWHHHRPNHVRLVRDKEVIWKGPIASLKRVKEDVREVSKGQECGILLQGFNDFKEGDILQAYEVTYLTPEL